MMLEIGPHPIDPAAALALIRKRAPAAGAVVSFTGCVRAEDGRVSALLLEAYSPLTERGIAAAMEETRRRWPLEDVLIKHRTGWIEAGETIVFVAAAAAHRRAAFEAADYLMDALKTDAVFWKKERANSGEERWIEPRPEDHEDRARWEVEG